MQIETFDLIGPWHPQAEVMSDEHHVVAVSSDPSLRITFGSSMAAHLGRGEHTEICPIYGQFVHSLEDLAAMLSCSVPGEGPVAADWQAITERLRGAHERTRRRFIVFHEAHALAQAAPDIFWRAVDVMMGVAAELEYASEEKLLLTRCLFVGTPMLLELPAFRGWWPEGRSQPLWQVVSGLEAPATLGLRLRGGAGE